MIERVTVIAAAENLPYDYSSIRQTNTVKAHELLHFAKGHGRQLEMKERLLSAYFVEGRHVGRLEDLGDLAADVGLDRAAVLAALESAEFLPAVKADVAQARAYGIQGVPFFVFDGRFGVSGAQESSTFLSVLNQVVEEKDSAR